MPRHIIDQLNQGVLTPDGGEFPVVFEEPQTAALGGVAVAAETVPTPEEDPEIAILKAEVRVLNYFGRENKALRNIWAQGRKVALHQENRTMNHPGFAQAVEKRENSRLAAARLKQLAKKSFAEIIGIEVIEVLGENQKDPATAFRVRAKDPNKRRELEIRYQQMRNKFAEPSNDSVRKARKAILEEELQRKKSL